MAVGDETGRLIQHPEFKAAATVAPHFVSDCLLTIRRLQQKLADAGINP